jgi:hypothetical protein
MNSKFLLIVAAVLVIFGLLKPNLNSFIPSRPDNVSIVVVEKPSNPDLLEATKPVIEALSLDPERTTDGKRLAELYNDLATLVQLDGENTVIKNTEEISQANAISGLLLRLDIKGKYPELARAAKDLMVKAIGDDMVELDTTLRSKAVEGFKALSWACLEGSK